VAVLLEFDVEGLLEIAYGSRQHYGPARKFGASFMHLETEFLGELLDLVDVGRIGTVDIFVLGARHVLETSLFEGAP